MKTLEISKIESVKKIWDGLLVVGLLILIGNLHQYFISETLSIFFKNLIWHTVGIVLFVILTFYTDIRKLSYKLVWYIYLSLTLTLMIMAIFKKRWINLGIFSIQPSEFIKVILLLLISLYLAREPSSVIETRKFFKIILMILLPLVFVFPTDLDYAFIMGVMFFSWILFVGISKRLFIGLLVGGLFLSIIAIPIFWSKLKPHQKGRIYGYLYPERYAQTWGYQLNQSLIAIGSGGLTGFKFYKGWSTRLGYLPAKHTDLTFAVWAESWGLIGVSLFLLLYGYLIYFGLKVSKTAKDWFGRYLSLGISLVFLWQMFFNLGGCSGLLPMTSIPLPFLSYGGSITISVYFLLSLLFNVAIKRYFFK